MSEEKKTLETVNQTLLNRVVKGQVLDTGHVEHVYDNVLREFGGVSGYARTVIELYEDPATSANNKVQLLKLVKELAADADKSRRADREYELVETQDLLRIVAQALGTDANPIQEIHDVE